MVGHPVTRKLGDVVTFRGGGTPSTERAEFWRGDIPWVSPKDMKFDLISDAEDKISEAAIAGSATSLIPTGACLVVVRSGILARTVPVGLTAREVAVNQDIKALCPSATIEPKYLFYFLKNAEPALLRKVTRGATVHRLATHDLRDLCIPVPSLAEQKRIVAILDEAFEGIAKSTANAERNVANARELFAGVLRNAFSDQSEWRSFALGDRVRFIDYRGKTPPKTESGVRLITAKNVKMGFIQRNPEEFIDADAYDDWMTRGFPKQGDVLFTTEAPLGNVAQLDTDETVVIGQRLITMKPDENFIGTDFLKWLLMSPDTQAVIWKLATGATVQGIKARLLKTVPLAAPELTVQQKVSDRLESAWTACGLLESKYEEKIAQLSALKAALLHKAFSGQLAGKESIAA